MFLDRTVQLGANPPTKYTSMNKSHMSMYYVAMGTHVSVALAHNS